MRNKNMGRTRAVVAGINNYPDPGHNLPSCVQDALSVAELLRTVFAFDSVVELHDAAANLDDVLRALGEALDGVTEDDRVVFYYSGHGTQTIRHDELRESLCLYDRLLNDDVLVEASLQIPPGVLTVVLDSCFSGGMSKDRLSAPIKSRVLLAQKGTPPSYRPFGCGSRINYGPIIAANSKLVVSKVVEETGPQLNGLLVSACLENETAAASTASTEGLSAFTYGLRRALDELGGSTEAAPLMTRVIEVLREINIVQSPQLHPPVMPAMDQLPLFVASSTKAADTSLFVATGDLIERVMLATIKASTSNHL